MFSKLPIALLGLYLFLFTLLGIEPYERTVWWAENMPILMIVFLLASTYPFFRFSNISYLMMSVLIVLHTIGGHYTFERVPFDLITNFFGFERNHYDRLAHFSVGFYAFAIAEVLLKKEWVNSKFVLFSYPLLAILSIAALYELFEWQYAVYADASAGIAVLGSQGDVWDAQKDIFSDSLGSLVAMGFFSFVYAKEIARIPFNRSRLRQ
ncbi:MAG: DUF2238 domain-containing protein [Campylobacterales bacterium]|nr:DUF2238 domain-containing protein [Campylobacterales bacterium]